MDAILILIFFIDVLFLSQKCNKNKKRNFHLSRSFINTLIFSKEKTLIEPWLQQ